MNERIEIVDKENIHPDFKLEHPDTPQFRQNIPWDRDTKGGPTEIKVVFTFDDSKILTFEGIPLES